jgi:uncharacterized Zn finger protein
MIAGRLIATTFWGRAWCDNMESYRDYESRLPRGRTYVRNGSVVDLQIASGRITALVSGSELYSVTITIKETVKTQWETICADCAGGIDSLVELLQGRLSRGVMERLCRQENGLFPRPSDIRFSCSCPDHALMCKHVAAVLYGVAARLDYKPELLFRLRAVDETDLVTQINTDPLISKKGSDKVLQADDMSALFGLDMAPEPEARRLSDDLKQSEVRGTIPGAQTAVAAPIASRTASPRLIGVPRQASAAQQPSTKSSVSKKSETKARKASDKIVVPKQKETTLHDNSTRSTPPTKAVVAKLSAKLVGLEKGLIGKRRQPKTQNKKRLKSGLSKQAR